MRLTWVLIGGALFGSGLALSGMTRPEVILSFLGFEDFGLMLVMAGAIAVTATAFHLGPRALRTPPCGAYTPSDRHMRRGTLPGAALFGIGWGIAGMCPGAMLGSLGTGNWPILFGIAGTFAGAYLQGRFAPGD
jgi:uncharacterized membrane protein YedE/YeeE